MEIVALVLAIVALPLPFIIERIKRPRFEIEARTWVPKEPVPWTFAIAYVRNKPLNRVLRTLFVREIAGGVGRARLPARWSPCHPRRFRRAE